MSLSNSHRLPHLNGCNSETFLNGHDAVAHDHHNPSLESWGEDDTLSQELQRLAATHEELRAATGLQPTAHTAPEERSTNEEDETTTLRRQNTSLRAKVEELEQMLLEAAQQRDVVWAEQQKEYEALIEEKSEVIRELHMRLQEQKGPGRPEARPDDDAAITSEQESLLVLKEELEKQRAQLDQDEAAVMDQMKQMEMTMSRERVEVARQRNELQRLQNEFQHELEMAAREAGLRERLAPLQRRQQEMVNNKGVVPARPSRPVTQIASPPPAVPSPTPTKPSSGIFRRLFGGNKA